MKSYSIDPAVHPGPVALTTPNLDRLVRFYESTLGLQQLSRSDAAVELGAEPGQPLLRLFEDPQAAPPPRNSTGLYHFAILLPSRPHLAQALQRLVENNYPLQGAADHWVSEALYLGDPDGNGIEIYRDRPSAEWPYSSGQLQMGTDPLNLRALLEESTSPTNGMPPGSRMGHVHLRVASIPAADDFYVRVIGLDLMLHFGSQAGFVSAGGYHHHLGYNIWESAGAAPPPSGSSGLRYFSLILPSQTVLDQAAERLEAAGALVQFTPDDPGTLFTQDPFGSRLMLTVQNFS